MQSRALLHVTSHHTPPLVTVDIKKRKEKRRRNKAGWDTHGRLAGKNIMIFLKFYVCVDFTISRQNNIIYFSNNWWNIIQGNEKCGFDSLIAEKLYIYIYCMYVSWIFRTRHQLFVSCPCPFVNVKFKPG